MTIWTAKEKPPVLDKFCHLSLDAQKVMASLYRDFHQRKAEILASRSSDIATTGFQRTNPCDSNTRYNRDPLYNLYSKTSGRSNEQLNESSKTSGCSAPQLMETSNPESASPDRSTYSDSPPLETQDFRLLTQICRDENVCQSLSPPRPSSSVVVKMKPNSTNNGNRNVVQSSISSPGYNELNLRHQQSGPDTSCRSSTNNMDMRGFQPGPSTSSSSHPDVEDIAVYEVMNCDTGIAFSRNKILVGPENDGKRYTTVTSNSRLQVEDSCNMVGQSDTTFNASQALFSQDTDISTYTKNVPTPRKSMVTNSTNTGLSRSTDMQCCQESIVSNNQNFIFKPVIIPFNSESENMHDTGSDNPSINIEYEKSHDVKRRRTEPQIVSESADSLRYKSKVNPGNKGSKNKSRDIREFMNVSHLDEVEIGQGAESFSRPQTDGYINNGNSVAKGSKDVARSSNIVCGNFSEESPFPNLNDTHHSNGKVLDMKKSKFKVPVKSRYEQQLSSSNGIVDVSKLPEDVQEDTLSQILEATEVVITLVYRNGSTQLRDCLFGSDKKKSTGKMRLHTEVESIAVRNEDNVYLFPVTFKSARDFFQALLQKTAIRKVGFHVKDLLIALQNFMGLEKSNVDLSWMVLDAGIAVWLLDPDHPVSCLEQLLSVLKIQPQTPNDSCIDALPEDMYLLSTAMHKLFQELQRRDLWTLFLCLETPLVNVITSMELRSLTVSTHTLLQFSTLLKKNLSRLDQKAHKAAGHAFVLNSHHQLRQVLFEELRLDAKLPGKTKLAKTNVTREMSTSESVLTQLSPFHPLPGIVLEYRHLQKLKSVYVDGILSCVVDDQLVTHWDQTSAATGRLTSYQPNIQAIPKTPLTISDCRENFIIGSDKPGEESIDIYARDAFIARKNYSFLAADFQQIELRLLSHLANDPVLLELFNNPDTPDIFNALTSQWLGKRVEDIEESEREQTKRIVYSVMYGVGKDKLSQYLKCKPDDAKAIMNSFLLKFPAVSQFTVSCVKFCQEKGYTASIFKRRRLFANINTIHPMLRAQAERQCVNFCVQGSAADICKAAMLQVQKALVENPDLDARLIVQIHDEILLEVADSDLNKVIVLVKEVMENRQKLCGTVVQLRVPIPVSVSVGKTWGHMEQWTSKE